MIEGVVNADYQPVFSLVVQGPSGRSREIEVVVDTGFSGYLTLPPDPIAALELPFLSGNRATLADGSEITFPSYGATVLWDGRPILVAADAADTAPLAGMRLLDGHDLSIRVRSGGPVLIRALA